MEKTSKFNKYVKNDYDLSFFHFYLIFDLQNDFWGWPWPWIKNTPPPKKKPVSWRKKLQSEVTFICKILKFLFLDGGPFCGHFEFINLQGYNINSLRLRPKLH